MPVCVVTCASCSFISGSVCLYVADGDFPCAAAGTFAILLLSLEITLAFISEITPICMFNPTMDPLNPFSKKTCMLYINPEHCSMSAGVLTCVKLTLAEGLPWPKPAY